VNILKTSGSLASPYVSSMMDIGQWF
jgi:hypothetical protein